MTILESANPTSFNLFDEAIEGLTSRAAIYAASATEAGVPVVALRPGRKEPLSGHGLGSRSQPFRRGEQVLDYEADALHSMGERPNWGILCGTGLAVLDLDGPDGRVWLDELAAKYDEVALWARSTLRVTTGRKDGGVHLYGAVPDGVDLKTAAGALHPHVDVRGQGFYVVGPGCRHESGAFYRIATDLGYHLAAEHDETAVSDLFRDLSEDGVTTFSALTVPDVLLDLMRRPEVGAQAHEVSRGADGAATVGVSVADLPRAPSEVAPSAYVEKAVQGVLAELEELSRLGEGRRNARGHGWDLGTFAAAMRLVELSNADADGHPLDEVREQFLASCPRDRQFGSRRAEHKWASAVEKVGQRPAEIDEGVDAIEIVTADEEIVAEVLGEESDSVDKSVDTTPSQWSDRVATGGTFLFDRDEEEPPLWGNGDRALWERGESLLIYSSPGVGKTTLAGLLARCRLDLDKELLGMPVASGNRRVLYLAMDRPRQAQRALSRQFHPSERATVDDRLRVWQGPLLDRLDQNPKLFAELADAYEADTLIVDSLKDTALPLAEDQGGVAYNIARQNALAAGVEMIELHHARKATGEGRKKLSIDDVYGSMHLTSGSGTVLALQGDPADSRAEMFTLRAPRGDVWMQVEIDRSVGTVRNEEKRTVLDVLRENGPLLVREVAALVEGVKSPSKAAENRVRRELTSEAQRGLVEIEDVSTPGGGRPRMKYRALRPEDVTG